MAVNDNPMAIIPRVVDMRNSVEWNKKSPRNPMALIVVPIINDFEILSFDIMKPEVGPNTSNIRANGNCTLVALIGSPPKPNGSGFLTNMGMV